MAQANQIYTILNAVAKQQYGTAPVTVVDTSTMIALGDMTFQNDKNVDGFMGALTDRIGRTIFSIRMYEGADENVVKHSFDYGVILQKIYVKMPDTTINTSWEIGKEDFTPSYAPVVKPVARQKLFDSLDTFEIDMTIPDEILKTAFLNETAMATFISAIFTAVENRIEVAMESLVNLCRAAFIARKLIGNKSCGAINLLTAYNAQFGASLTTKEAMYNSDFLKFSASQINLWVRRMRKMSTLFNEEGYERHTRKEDLVLTLLDDFAANTASYLQADTFHDELVALPRFNTVPYWQGSGEEYSFTSLSSINVKLSETETVSRSGILAVAYDWQAMGVTINRRNTRTQYNPKDEYTNYYNKLTRGLFNDMSENAIVFYIEDATKEARSASVRTRRTK